MLRIFVGYDSKEPVAYHTLVHSVLRHASIPVSISPVKQSLLGALYSRPRGPTESTEFSLSRFLVPALSQYEGWSMFMDCDMLCRADVAGLVAEIDRQSEKAVLVCKHDYTPSPARKFLNQVQTVYPRKNWSSVMLMNGRRCTALTRDYVNSASGLDLHRFNWVDDAQIGELPIEWNWLVGEYKYNPAAKIVHFTRGGPYFADYRNCDYAEEWREEYRRLSEPFRD
ncbi:MAG TPA: glycosyltransferase [Burkholderiales bacterium]|nr:glycosyltransferase [Burkholderiales bacterium]